MYYKQEDKIKDVSVVTVSDCPSSTTIQQLFAPFKIFSFHNHQINFNSFTKNTIFNGSVLLSIKIIHFLNLALCEEDFDTKVKWHFSATTVAYMG